jgi:hypothetical protein
MKRDTGLDTLLSMDSYMYVYPNKYWWRIKAREVEVSKERPHGIRYTFTLHDPSGTRIFGMDNKHIPKNRRNGYHGQIIEYDHVHKDEADKGTAYAFINAETLMTDFLNRVKEVMDEIEGTGS